MIDFAGAAKDLEVRCVELPVDARLKAYEVALRHAFAKARREALTEAAITAREGVIRRPFGVLSHEEEKQYLRGAIGAAIEDLRDKEKP